MTFMITVLDRVEFNAPPDTI